MPPPAPTTRRRHRHLAVVALVLAAAFALSGCVQIRAFDVEQIGSIGDVAFVFDACGSQAGNPDCGLGSSGLASNETGTGQVLLGIKIDARFVPPAGFTTVPPNSQPFTASPSYTAELTRLDPPGPGRKWAGYISDARTYTPGLLVGASVPIVRPLFPDGSPNSSTFGVTWRIGSRGVLLPDAPATRPVTCGDSLTEAFQADLTICSDESSFVAGSQFNDFGFLTPAAVTVQPGQTAVIPITGTFTGPARPAINFALTATTTVPGATAVTNATLAPAADSTAAVPVSVAVPPGTAPGSYAVTLTGTLPSGETRAATGSVIVAGPGGAPGGTATAPLCGGRPATIVGSAGADRLRGTAGPDVIAALGGDDRVSGLGGADIICGGAGADRLAGGAGADRLIGGVGPDRLLGGPGRDRLLGGPGADRLLGGLGVDALIGGAGRNIRVQ